ncbi:inositol 2-dehydrogenase [uncultured Dysosmobacter sp.]|uniref:inositol 2-dehydrogenase n=1 Tax=uncultured Dysosmobacter sp. TaxID=2591384 RepID=UPI00260D4DED|nr:inositol 2-dehydrogenase [uncultured Dysosmobacter sp.]
MIQVGIIGAGRIGRVHIQGILSGVPNAHIRGIAAPHITDEIKTLARSAGTEILTQDFRVLLRDSRIDAVLICSPTSTHADISVEALQAGKHVFCEKPVDLGLVKIQTVIDAAAVSGVKYQVGFNRRFDHNYQALHRAVSSGQVGQVQMVKICSRDSEPPTPKFIPSSGGLFLDMTVHDLDMVRFLSGSEVEEVYAAGSVLVDEAIGRAGDVDTAAVMLRLESGALALIDNSRRAVYGYDQRAEVFGSLGCVSIDNDTPSTAVLSTAGGVISEKPHWFFLERYLPAFQEEVRQFIDAVANDYPVPVGAEDARKATLLAMACTRSARERRPVRMDEFQTM